MTSSSIHHRKSKRKAGSGSKSHHRYYADSDPSSSPHSTSDSSSSSSSSRQPPNHALPSYSLTAAVAAVASLALIVVLPLSLLLRSSATLSPLRQNKIREARTIALRTKDPSFGVTPLTGSYALSGEDFLLQNNATSDSWGSIEFPPLDLWSALPEEAKEYQLRFMMAFRQPFNSGLLRNGGDPRPDPLADSFLGPDLKFESVVAGSGNPVTPLVGDRALLTRRGFKRNVGRDDQPNQDSSLIANFFIGFDRQPEERGERAMLIGVFDGHGERGHAVSQWCALELPRRFARIMRQKQSSLPQPLIDSIRNQSLENQVVNYIKQSLTEAFMEVDEHEPVKGTAGSTASMLFYPGLGSKVYIANVGDSVTLIATYSKSKKESRIVFQNRKHKPHLEEERQRIERAGGSVLIPPSVLQAGDASGSSDELKESSRVMIPDGGGNPFGGLALAMSRSIGDFDGKAVGLIAEPDVIPFDVKEYYAENNFSSEQIEDTMWFAVAASDGVYDLLKPQLVAEYLGSSLNNGDISPLEACERIIREASRLWMKSSALIGSMPYRDDISIAVGKINISSI